MCRGAFVLYKERNEFRRFRPTCVTAEHMEIVGTFIERLTGSEDHFLPTAYLHYDGPLREHYGDVWVQNRLAGTQQ
jgi:hypothetical protein